MPFTVDLPTVFAFVIAFAIFAYVVMDGFDLGIGILFPALPAGRERDSAMNSIAPVWDGNETWLVLGGGGLLGCGRCSRAQRSCAGTCRQPAESAQRRVWPAAPCFLRCR